LNELSMFIISSKNYEVIFEIDDKRDEIKKLETKTNAQGFWDDNDQAQSVLKQITIRKSWVDQWEDQHQQIEDLDVLVELLDEDPESGIESEIVDQLTTIEKNLDALEFRRMFRADIDVKNAIITIHPGAGGTESQDWAEMLMRMYLRFCEQTGFKTETLDFQVGEEAGVKSVTIEVVGEYAYGYLKAEAGVHRLVRISPFDSNKRRHTSFASVYVLPEIDEKIDIEINPTDLKIDTYRASGAGGQHVNKTDSAIRITHLPSGIVVQCQNERSQHKNKANAMKILAGRLYKLKEEEQRMKKEKMGSEKKDIGWGSQIRSYVFHPYNMVKDHRTGYETSNTGTVMDGDLHNFIKEYLVAQ
jgi:peptide chain release factor 2